MSSDECFDVIKMGQEIRDELRRARDWNEWADDMDESEYMWESSAESLWNTYKELFPAFASGIEKEYESK